MKKILIPILPIFLSGFAFFSLVIDLNAQCDAILRSGIYDYQSTSTFREKAYSFVNWYKNKNIQTFQEAKSATGDAGIPFESIVVNMGFSYSESGFREFQSYIETFNSKSEYEKLKFDETIRKINPFVVSAWNDCINRYGLHLWIEHTENPYEFILCANFIDDDGGGKPAQITGIDFGSGKVSTTSAIFYSNGKINKNTILSGTVKRQIFTRQNDKALNIVVNVSRGGGLSYSFREIYNVKRITDESLEILKEKLTMSPTAPLLRFWETHGKRCKVYATEWIKPLEIEIDKELTQLTYKYYCDRKGHRYTCDGMEGLKPGGDNTSYTSFLRADLYYREGKLEIKITDNGNVSNETSCGNYIADYLRRMSPLPIDLKFEK